MRKTCLGIASLLMILQSSVVRGDDQLPPPLVFAKAYLQLTDEQTGALITMIQMRGGAMEPIAAKLHANQEALGKLIESSNPDAATVGALLIKIHAGEKQLGTIAHDAAASFEQTLLPEQLERLQFVRQAAQVEPAIPALRAIGLM